RCIFVCLSGPNPYHIPTSDSVAPAREPNKKRADTCDGQRRRVKRSLGGGSRSMLGDLLQRKPYNAVTDFIDAPVVRGLADKIAFMDPERSLSYGDLQARTCRFAAALADLDLRPEERLGLLLYDSIDFPVAFWGALRAGVVALPLNTLLTAEQYAYILSDSR